MLHARVDDLGRHRQVIHPAAGNAELLIEGVELGLELFVGARIVETSLHEEERSGKVGKL
jgi:hypothetical protein